MKSRKTSGFTLVEIMIVVAIIALLAALAVPSFIRARQRAQASNLVNDARILSAAVDQYMIENPSATQASITFANLTPYLKDQSRLVASNGTDIFGNALLTNGVVAIAANSKTRVSPAVTPGDNNFWSGY